MPFIDRDEAGKIKGVYACRQREGQEWIAEDHADWIAYQTCQAKVQADNEAKAALASIDLKSIRSIREWLAKQADAPQFVKDHEAAAVSEREKLK